MNTKTNHIASPTSSSEKKNLTTQAEIDAIKAAGSNEQSVTGFNQKDRPNSHDLAFGS